MTLRAAIDVLKPLLATVTGIRTVLEGQPGTVHNPPLIFLELGQGERATQGQQTRNLSRIEASVVIDRQGNTVAERDLMAYINSVPAAVDANPTLTGTANLARVAEWIPDYFTIGEKEHRRVRFIIEIIQKAQYGSGI